MRINYERGKPKSPPLIGIQLGNGLRIDIGAGRVSIGGSMVDHREFSRVSLQPEGQDGDGSYYRSYTADELDKIGAGFADAANAQRELSK